MKTHINILLIEDVEDDALLTVHCIQKSDFTVSFRRVEKRMEMIHALTEERFDVVLADFHLPHFSALDALDVLRELCLDLPFIVVSGTIGEETAVDLMRAGAHDYVMKDNLSRLPSAIRREIKESYMRAEKRQNADALSQSENKLKNQVVQQSALLAVNRSVQDMTEPSDLARVVKVCFDQLNALGFNFRALAIQRMIDANQGVFDFYEIQPTEQFHYFCRVSPNLARLWRMGDTVYRPDLDNESGGLEPADRKKMSERYGYPVKSILNICFDKGVLSILSDAINPFTEEEIGFAENIAMPLSVGMSRIEDMEKLVSVIQSIPEGICLFDGAEELAFANALGEQYLDLLDMQAGSPLHITGKSLDELCFATRDVPLQIPITHKNDMVLDVVVRPVTEERATGGWVVVFRNVTQKLHTDRLAMTQARLASVGQMAAGIAHDFNNMLTVMNGFAQILEMNPKMDQKAKDDLALIRRQGEQAAQLVRQILDCSRENNNDRHVVDLLPFLKEAVKLLEHTLPETILIKTQIAPGDYTVLANTTQINQVLQNLAFNARDAMPDGGKLTLVMDQIEVKEDGPIVDMPAGKWLKLSVSDTGVGMSQGVLEHIFEPFFTTKKMGEGTGLGLAQVFGIVNQHEGFIGVESSENTGTTFTLYLPLIVEDENLQSLPKEIPNGHGEHILVVEDNKEVLQSIKKILKTLNYEVSTASSVQKALDLLSERNYLIDAILTDLVMPERSGLDLFNTLRQGNIMIPLTIMTGYPYEIGKLGGRLQDTNGVILKPITIPILANKMRDILQHKTKNYEKENTDH